jgi:hypothetical protein
MKAIVSSFFCSASFALMMMSGSEAGAATPTPVGFGLPPESVTVTATRPSAAVIEHYVEKRIAPTRMVNKMARWRRPICPLTAGLGDKYAKYLTQRIRDVATAVGAPVSTDQGCKPNIEVVFTTTPQAFMDGVRHTGPAFLGYHDGNSQADELAKVRYPIQAWYATESLDMDGSAQVDSGQCSGIGTTMNNFIVVETPGYGGGAVVPITLNLGCARVMHWNGSRINNGYDSGFNNVLIVAEPAKLSDYEVGSLADYVTMLALSQPPASETCQDLPSISNLLAKGCTSAATKITDGDLAFLKGLYRVPSGYGLDAQQTAIRYQMEKTLVTDKGG